MFLNCGVGEDPWESLRLQDIKPVHCKGDQSWMFIGRTYAEAETPILWPSDSKNWLIWKDPDAGKNWRWEEKGMTEDEMASPTWWTWVWASSSSWRKTEGKRRRGQQSTVRLDSITDSGHVFELTPGDGEGQGGLTCCSPWGHRVRHDWATELNWDDR